MKALPAIYEARYNYGSPSSKKVQKMFHGFFHMIFLDFPRRFGRFFFIFVIYNERYCRNLVFPYTPSYSLVTRAKTKWNEQQLFKTNIESSIFVHSIARCKMLPTFGAKF